MVFIGFQEKFAIQIAKIAGSDFSTHYLPLKCGRKLERFMQKGMTLVELLIGLAIISIVLSFVVPLWHLLGALGDWPWSLDAEVNRAARESVRNDVTAVQVLAWILCIVAGLIPAVKEVVIASGFLLGLMGPGPWVGLFRAIFATHWTKKSAEKAGAPVVNAADTSAPAAATNPVPVAACGSKGNSDVTVMAERSRAGEEGADAAKRLLVKNAQERRSLPTAVVIGAVSCALIVRYLRRRT